MSYEAISSKTDTRDIQMLEYIEDLSLGKQLVFAFIFFPLQSDEFSQQN